MKRIAIIGSGISGLTTAYHLAKKHKVTLFEAADYLGGHTHTVDVDLDGEQSSIDTGFIVFNDHTYPNFISLLEELEVAYQPTEMSFSVRNDAQNLEYNGHTFFSLFAQKSNIFRPTFWRMLSDIRRFNQDVRSYLHQNSITTIGEYLDQKNYGHLFSSNYLIPMISAIWSMDEQEALDFPLQLFIHFFDNHGLLNLVNRPQWYTIVGGSRSYIPAMIQGMDKIYLDTPVTGISRLDDHVRVEIKDAHYLFDEVVLALHGDQALALLHHPTQTEKEVLTGFTYTSNTAILHYDDTILPKRKAAWASWNYRVSYDNPRPTLTYNMNILQRLQKKQTYLVTLNSEVASEKILQTMRYSHPRYSVQTLQAQKRWREISGTDRVHFCGAYWFNGFHEDGVRSGLRVVQDIEQEGGP